MGRPRRGSVGNTKMHFREVEFDGMDWIVRTQNMDQRKAVVNTVMNHRITKVVGNSWVAAHLAASQNISDPWNEAYCLHMSVRNGDDFYPED
jgi:hypothetical protein